ncbi:myotubularin-related protein 7-like [Morone saxatilis]|uniref:myotubularin-related protein 7-like n=1 Tax=Morone saxatilis TaxID=34816 RepID=UPI0015E21164|nr:myotubularin-related protein 7-like [Morone saxatilis]
MEHIRTPKVENVRLLDRSSGQRKASSGTLYLSATHTIFVENNPETRKETWERTCFGTVQTLIGQVGHDQGESTAELYCLVLYPHVNKEGQRKSPWNLHRLMTDLQEDGEVPKNPVGYYSQPTVKYRQAHALPSSGGRLNGSGVGWVDFLPLSSLPPGHAVGEMRSPSMTDFLWGLENSGWLKHIKAILDAGVFIARAVADEGVSVLVHCSDGWDRTAQACSVASILLDPFYRTIKGLMVLIEKDWVSFGHKFSHRYAHLDGDPKEVSPVIDQFLECVWQLSEQFPCAFEFNERFLVAIHTHVYSCHFGTFLGNCQKERRDMRLRERSHSVWPQLWKDRAEYTNPLYNAELSQTQGVLRPNTTPYCFKMWKGLYNHMEKSTPPRQSPADFLSAVREESQQLEEELTNHQERIAALTGKPITWEQIKVPRRRTSRLQPRHCGPDPPTTYTDPITSPAQDNGHTLSSEPANQKAQTKDPVLILPLGPHTHLKSHDPDDLSTCSDLESGVADLSSRSSSGGDDRKDPDSDEAAFATA